LASFVEKRTQIDAGIELTSKLYEKKTKRTDSFLQQYRNSQKTQIFVAK
jgi:hypothetical protein